jgi:hypothetical protein
MDYNYFISSLENSVKKIKALVEGVSEEQAKWKPQSDKWSILEVVNHLYDEEKDDFRKRIDLTIHTPEKDWPGIDPERWVQSHEYYKRDYQPSVNNFLNERIKSLKWLRALPDPDWEQVHQHPIIGPLAAGDLLASWATHDYLHLRQLSNLQARYLNVLASPFSTKYSSP